MLTLARKCFQTVADWLGLYCIKGRQPTNTGNEICATRGADSRGSSRDSTSSLHRPVETLHLSSMLVTARTLAAMQHHVGDQCIVTRSVRGREQELTRRRILKRKGPCDYIALDGIGRALGAWSGMIYGDGRLMLERWRGTGKAAASRLAPIS